MDPNNACRLWFSGILPSPSPFIKQGGGGGARGGAGGGGGVSGTFVEPER